MLNGAEDDLCTQYDQAIYEVGTGPFPITDTHPNCRCERIPFATSDDTNPTGVGAPIQNPGPGGGAPGS